MIKALTTILLAAVIALPATAAPAPVARDKRVWAAAEAARPEQLKLLESIVNIGTGDVEGGRKVGDIMAARLVALGATVERVPAEMPGLPDNVVATLTGTGKGRVLLIGHLDTVFDPGTVAKRPFRIEGTRELGPGVSDEKGGVVQGVYTLQILRDLKFADFRKIVLLIETSEERGDAPDVLTVWRKGSNSFYIDVKGRAAHAGVAPQDGRNAAEDASAAINVRVRDKADAEKVARALDASARQTMIPDTKVTIRREAFFPPLPSNPATDALAGRARPSTPGWA